MSFADSSEDGPGLGRCQLGMHRGPGMRHIGKQAPKNRPKNLDSDLDARLSKLEAYIYDLKRQELDALIAQRLLVQEAAKRGYHRHDVTGR